MCAVGRRAIPSGIPALGRRVGSLAGLAGAGVLAGVAGVARLVTALGAGTIRCLMATSGEFGSLRHLAGRFFGALLPFGPPQPDERWAQDHLLAGERTLWQRMSGADRRHAVGVARRTVDELAQAGPPPEPASRAVVAAALLHDVGKVEAGLGTWARAGVTFAAMAVGRDRIVSWSGARGPTGGAGAGPGAAAVGATAVGATGASAAGAGQPHEAAAAGVSAAGSVPTPVSWRAWRRRIGLYLRHDGVGADLLSSAGSDPLTVAWAGEHHRPPERWSVDTRVGSALKLADDD